MLLDKSRIVYWKDNGYCGDLIKKTSLGESNTDVTEGMYTCAVYRERAMAKVAISR